MARAMRIHRTGGPEVFVEEEVELGALAPGEVRLRQTACGLGFIDTHQRSGQSPLPRGLPCILGQEAAGVVLAIGADVRGLKPGDRVVYADRGGAYCNERNIAAERLVPIPDAISDVEAAAVFNQGLTAEYLLRRAYPVKAGDTVMVHATSGAVGLVLCQWAKHLGAITFGTVSTEAKAVLARANGCDHVILHPSEKFAERAHTLNQGAGLDVVYDSTGKDTFAASLDSLRPGGLLVVYGESSGVAPPVDARTLAEKGGLRVARLSLPDFDAPQEDYRAAARALFALIAGGAIKIHAHQTYRLADLAQAHRELEARKTIGSSVLIP
jgi:NADPH:quinone reductase